MQDEDLSWLERDGLDSLDIVERVMAREIADATGPDAGEEDASLVRNRPPKDPRGHTGAAAKLEEED